MHVGKLFFLLQQIQLPSRQYLKEAVFLMQNLLNFPIGFFGVIGVIGASKDNKFL